MKREPLIREPARKKAVGWNDESTRTCGTEEYLGYGLAGTPNKTVVGADTDQDVRASQKSFKKALLQNVNGIGVKNSDRMHNQNDYLGDIGFADPVVKARVK